MFKKFSSGLIGLLLLAAPFAHAFEPTTQKVTDNVYAIIGELDQRSADNQGLNNTIGFIITTDGVVLVGSGATAGSAKMLEAAVKKVTDKPIKQVMNIGVQDHHWMGNSHFLAQKILVSALAKTVASQHEQEPMNRMRLASAIGGKPEDLKVEYASETFDSDEKDLTIGGVEMSLRYLGDAHFLAMRCCGCLRKSWCSRVTWCSTSGCWAYCRRLPRSKTGKRPSRKWWNSNPNMSLQGMVHPAIWLPRRKILAITSIGW